MSISIGRYFVIAVLGIAVITLCGLPVRAGTTGSIQGSILDDIGHALVGVNVTAASPSGHFTTTSASNGFYALTGLPLDTYVVTLSKEGFQTQTIPGITIVQDQPYRLNAHLSTGPKSLGRITVRGTTSLVQPTVTSDSYVVNQQRLSDINGTPQDLNGFQAFNSLPGVTTDNFGYPTIRAGAENDIGYQLDGVDNTDAVTGQFLNAVSLNGARSVQLSTGGYDVSNGNTNSGVINEVVKRGTYPPEGQATIRLIAPTFGHEITLDYGNATPNNRFSYYLSFGGQRDASDYGDRATLLPLELGNTVFSTLNDSVVNLFYHFGDNNKNELQFLTNESGQTFSFNYLAFPPNAPYASNNGNVQASSDPFGLCSGLTTFSPPCTPAVLESNYLTLFPSQVGYQQNINTADTQSFNSIIDKLNFKRQLTASSFAEVRLFKTSENLIFWYPYNVGSFSDFYEDLQTTNLGEAFDYSNQLSSKNEIGFGGDGAYFNNRYFAAFPSFEPVSSPLESLGCAAAANNLPTPAQQAGGCYIAPFNAALNAAKGLGLPTDPGHAPLQTYPSDFSYSNDPLHR
ncbi:MAG TPA: carboxypeptidase regulatory-like domain-containing protein, partial [Candidatus Acidoferrales bacterium]|nr:carboxypeptidase regulatory-like domain-containing protein [Candidatus Acidoferrales bacterium]